jgi:membrane-associated phospholipid phosphatase
MRKTLPLLAILAWSAWTSVQASDEASEPPLHRAGSVARNEINRYARDARSLALAPLHWDAAAWRRFAEGTAAVGALYLGDRSLYDGVQRNRSAASDQFAKDVTPFGGRRALDVSVLLIAAGALVHDPNVRDAGRDSLEAELLAAGVVTPLLKRAFGRSRPVQAEGARSFHPFDAHFASFPSGHATNAFAAATAIAAHYDSWYVPAIAYSIASGVAVSRINDRAHFASDVLAGALIGRAVAKGIVWRHRLSTTKVTATPLVRSGGGAGILFSVH